MMRCPDVEGQLLCSILAVKRESHDLVETLRSTKTCWTSSDDKDVDIARGREWCQQKSVLFTGRRLELYSHIGGSHDCCFLRRGCTLESMQSSVRWTGISA